MLVGKNSQISASKTTVFRKDGNAQFLEETLMGAGLKRILVFGSLDAFGYEEAWQEEKLNVKIDFFSTEVLKAKP